MARTAKTDAEKEAAKKAAEKAAAERSAKLEKMTPDERKAFVREEKIAKFAALANKRVPKALDALRMIEALAAPNYAWTEEQKTKIMNVLKDRMDKLEAKLSGVKEAKGETFQL